MGLISQLIFGLWYITIAAGAVALFALLRKRLAKTFFMLAILLGVDVIRSLWLLYVGRALGGDGYRAAWIALQPVMIVLSAGVTVEGLVLQARRCYRFRWFGILLTSAFFALSLLVASAESAIRFPWSDTPAIELTTRYWDFVCLLTLLLSSAFLRWFSVQIDENVRRHVGILEVLFLGGAVAHLLRQVGTFWYVAATQFVLLGSALVCYLLWASKLVPESRMAPDPPRLSDEEFALRMADSRREYGEVVTVARRMREALFASRPSR